MARTTALDLDAPLRSLREVAGLTLSQLAEARGVRPPSEHEAEGLGSAIKLATLLHAAEAAGLTVEIRVSKKSTRR